MSREIFECEFLIVLDSSRGPRSTIGEQDDEDIARYYARTVACAMPAGSLWDRVIVLQNVKGKPLKEIHEYPLTQ